MNFPPFLMPYLGNGMVIGLNAVIHVLISHGIAVGAFAMMILGESKFGGFLSGMPAFPGWREFNKGFLRFIVFSITIVGPVTGAGIWFTIMTLASAGQGHMVRVFFWIWFFEYIIFFAEVVVLLLLYFQWDKLWERNKGGLVKLGVIYSLLAITSAVSISAILAFMLTPGAWVQTGSVWDAVLNPSFLPQAFSRVSFSFVLGSLIAMAAVALRGHISFRQAASQLYGRVLLVSTISFALSLLVYLYIIPRAFATQISFAVLSSHFSRYPTLLSFANMVFFATLIACAVAARTCNRTSRALIIPALLSIVVLVIQFERVREFIRGPYLMPGHMYANGLTLEEMPFLKEHGLAAASPWYLSVYPKDELSHGAFIFAQNCAICHTVGGLNNIRSRLKGRTIDGIYVIIGNIHEMVPFMPPFAGSHTERRTLAVYLDRVNREGVRFRSITRAVLEPFQ